MNGTTAGTVFQSCRRRAARPVNVSHRGRVTFPALVLFAFSLTLAGCQNNAALSTLSPFPDSRVPPPATGSYGQTGSYYQGPAVPNTLPGFEMNHHRSSTSLSQASFAAPPPRIARSTSDSSGTSMGHTGAEPVEVRTMAAIEEVSEPDGDADDGSSTSSTRLVSNEPPIRIIEPTDRLSSTASSGSNQAGEPKRFLPVDDVVEISEFSPPASELKSIEEKRVPAVQLAGHQANDSVVSQPAIPKVLDEPIGSGVKSNLRWRTPE